MWFQPSLWPGTTELCLGDKCGGKKVDDVTEGEVRSETGKKELFHQLDNGFAYVRSRETPQRRYWVSRGIPPPFRGAKRFKMGRPPHNSGYNGFLC